MVRFSSLFRTKKPSGGSSTSVDQANKIKSSVCASKRSSSTKTDKPLSSSSIETSSSSLLSTSTAQHPKSVHKIRQENAPVPKVIDKTPAHIQTVRNLLDSCNCHDNVAFRSFFTEDAVFQPEDVNAIPIEGMIQFNKHLNECFPDCKYTYTSIEKNEQDGTLVLDGAQFSGTHTGAPYTAAPELPPIPAKGDIVANDEERWFFDFDEETGKIKSWAIIAWGPITGPMGAYETLREAMS